MDFSKLNLQDHQALARQIVIKAIDASFLSREEFQKLRNSLIKRHGGTIFSNLYFVKAYEDLVKEQKIRPNATFLELIKKRSIRTMSGVVPLTVMTKAFPCPGRCIYCPTDVRMPKSYLPSQPAAQRGFRQRFNPYTQVFVRMKALQMEGHEVSKVDLRIIGGTWDSYPKKYQTWFVKRCLEAMNEFPQKMAHPLSQGFMRRSRLKSPYGIDTVNTLIIRSESKKTERFEEVIKKNEKALVRCIGINIETRPDFISEKEIGKLRKLGVTKVEIGVQTTFDEVQAITKRGHDLEAVRRATRLLKDAGFKVSYHMMPNLPGSNPKMDKQMIKELFFNEAYQPDYLKIYPGVVVPRTELSMLYQQGKFAPYDDATLAEILIDNLKSIPEYCRVDRLARDIPSTEIEAGLKTTNIRQLLEEKLKKQGVKIKEIRFREIMNLAFKSANVSMIERSYSASGGTEYFFSYEDRVQDKLIALLRLRFPGRTFLKELVGCALIRDLHVYGSQIPVGEKGRERKQHVGWGSELLAQAEKMALKAGYKKIAVIAGIGTREYYAKKGYRLEETYMVKVA